MYLFYPLLNVPIGQPFKGVSVHPGIDFGAATGTPVFAAGDGIVEASYTSQGHLTKEEGPPWSYGERIVITHPDGSQTTYNHLSARLVSKGDTVIAGQKIGEVGNTGYSFGPHLHFEYREGDGLPYVDPAPFLVKGNPPMISEEETDSGEGFGKLIVAIVLLSGVALGIAFIAKGA